MMRSKPAGLADYDTNSVPIQIQMYIYIYILYIHIYILIQTISVGSGCSLVGMFLGLRSEKTRGLWLSGCAVRVSYCLPNYYTWNYLFCSCGRKCQHVFRCVSVLTPCFFVNVSIATWPFFCWYTSYINSLKPWHQLFTSFLPVSKSTENPLPRFPPVFWPFFFGGNHRVFNFQISPTFWWTICLGNKKTAWVAHQLLRFGLDDSWLLRFDRWFLDDPSFESPRSGIWPWVVELLRVKGWTFNMWQAVIKTDFLAP